MHGAEDDGCPAICHVVKRLSEALAWSQALILEAYTNITKANVQ